ncbi:MAG: hypothetical protein Q9175_001988 [Cornicularia normoerica]
MTAVLRIFACFFSLSIAFALPSNLERLPQAVQDVDSITSKSNTTKQNPLTAYPVSCLDTRRPPTLIPLDGGFALNRMILQEPNVLKQRTFKHSSYQTGGGEYDPSRWRYGNCEISVFGHRHASQLLTLLDVALTADNIVGECVTGIDNPIGGVGFIGDVSKGFHVILQGYVEPGSISAKNSSISQRPAVSVSRRAIRSQHNSENPAASQGLETRDPLAGVSRFSKFTAIASNFTLSATAPSTYPVHCFNPFIIHLQPAVATDCGYIINEVILRLSDPTRQLTFGFTDAADINLSKPQYRKWQFGQCMVSLKNDNVAQADTFRLLDVATTARRISTQCLVSKQEKIGGTSSIGTDGKGFYVFVSAPLASSPVLSDVILSGESTGVESY